MVKSWGKVIIVSWVQLPTVHVWLRVWIHAYIQASPGRRSCSVSSQHRYPSLIISTVTHCNHPKHTFIKWPVGQQLRQHRAPVVKVQTLFAEFSCHEIMSLKSHAEIKNNDLKSDGKVEKLRKSFNFIYTCHNNVYILYFILFYLFILLFYHSAFLPNLLHWFLFCFLFLFYFILFQFSVFFNLPLGFPQFA